MAGSTGLEPAASAVTGYSTPDSGRVSDGHGWRFSPVFMQLRSHSPLILLHPANFPTIQPARDIRGREARNASSEQRTRDKTPPIAPALVWATSPQAGWRLPTCLGLGACCSTLPAGTSGRKLRALTSFSTTEGFESRLLVCSTRNYCKSG